MWPFQTIVINDALSHDSEDELNSDDIYAVQHMLFNTSETSMCTEYWNKELTVIKLPMSDTC